MGYLCEGGVYCFHGSDSTHWVTDYEEARDMLEGKALKHFQDVVQWASVCWPKGHVDGKRFEHHSTPSFVYVDADGDIQLTFTVAEDAVRLHFPDGDIVEGYNLEDALGRHDGE